MRINGSKPKSKNTMLKKKRKKNLQVATPGFEPAPQPPPVQKISLGATGSCDHYAKTFYMYN